MWAIQVSWQTLNLNRYLLSAAKKGTQSFAEFNQKSSFRQIILSTFSSRVGVRNHCLWVFKGHIFKTMLKTWEPANMFLYEWLNRVQRITAEKETTGSTIQYLWSNEWNSHKFWGTKQTGKRPVINMANKFAVLITLTNWWWWCYRLLCRSFWFWWSWRDCPQHTFEGPL